MCYAFSVELVLRKRGKSPWGQPATRSRQCIGFFDMLQKSPPPSLSSLLFAKTCRLALPTTATMVSQRISRRREWASTTLVISAALLIAGAFSRRPSVEPSDEAATARLAELPRGNLPILWRPHTIQAADTVVVFMSFACSWCSALEARLDSLEDSMNTGGVAIGYVVLGSPDSLSRASRAAELAYCQSPSASRQTHRQLYGAVQGGGDSLDRWLDACPLHQRRNLARRAERLGTALEIQGTPTVFTNRRRWRTGAPPLSALLAVLTRDSSRLSDSR